MNLRGWPGEDGRGAVAAAAGPALVAVAGFVCFVSWTIDPSGRVDGSLRWPAAVLAAAVGWLLFVRRRHDGVAGHLAAAVAATSLITLAIVATGDAGDRASVLTVPVAVFGAYVLPRLLALGLVVVLGASLAAALAATGVPAPALAWSVTMTTVASAAYAVRVLRRRVRRLLAQLGDDARRDHLTGILNRRGIDERLVEEMLRAQRTGERLSVLVGDLDGFKALNDRRGHAEGDRALRAVAAALTDATRATDVVGRLGGDEFVVVLTATDADGAADTRARILRALDERLRTMPEPVTVTFGTASFPGDGGSPGALLATADARLLSRKRAARTAPPHPPTRTSPPAPRR